MFEITMRRSSKKSIEAISVHFNDRQVKFNGKASVKLEKVIKEKNEPEHNLFECLNDYIEGTFSTEQQQALFKLYEQAHNIVESGKIQDYHTELVQVKPIINEILEMINVGKYCSYIQYSKHLRIPKDLSVAASKGDYPEQTTITDVDYVELVKLSFVTRVIFPIIFGLINRYESTMGNEFSEMVCGNLIKDNHLITSLQGWRKLVTYVQFTTSKRGIPVQVDSVSSSENFIEKILFSTIFSRLCCAVIPETEEGKNIATAINAAVKQHESGGMMLKKKDRPSDDDDDKRSIYDKYQISENVKSSDEVMQAEFFSMDLFDEEDRERHRDRFKHPCMGLGIKQPELVERVYDNLPRNWDFLLEDHILKILQLVYIEDVSPFVFEACDYTQLMAAIALAQVKLSEQGYKYIPSLLGAVDDPEGTRYLADGLKLSTEDKEYLASICEIQTRNNEGRSFNEALVTATEFLDKIANGRWKSNLEYGVLSDPEVYQRVKPGELFPMEIDIELKNEFIRLIRQVNE